MKSRLLLFALFGLFSFNASVAQTDDLLDEDPPEYTKFTFYSTRIVNSHTTEMLDKRTLDFRINHRFGELKGGYDNFFGLDNATMRMSFDYAIMDNLNIGIGRSTFERTLDGYVKYRFLRQIDKFGNMPISAVYVAGMTMNGIAPPTGRTNYFTSKLGFMHQVVVARKFSNKFSAQLMPTLIHRNLIDSSQFKNDVMSFGIGLKQKISGGITANLEYFYVLPNQISKQYYNPLSLGIDINTGDHTFQLHITNTRATFEKAAITQTAGSWLKGNIHFGFNLSRQFDL
ncbi:MAG: hypothetical protein H6607_07870 [Flavobacteriales bacterium]|nr:hypothetical protein [Flavobacteriales bacterium]